LRRAQDIIGLPVIEIKAGKQLGTAADLLIDREWNVQGVLLESKLWFGSPRFVPWEAIVAFGSDAVTVQNGQAVRPLDESADLVCLSSGASRLRGMPVITVNGEQLGLVEDVYIGDQLDKKIVGYELSDGFLSDLKEGRKWLPTPETATFGEDAVIVPVHSAPSRTPSFHETG
jgi:uncharacterized protein YrrD